MRTGIIVRANDKGLHTQTAELARAFSFDAQLLVLDGNKRWPEYPERFPDAIRAEWHWREDLHLDRAPVERFLHDIDVLLSVETLYDPGLAPLARGRGVKTVVQGNPEFYRAELYKAPRGPDRWCWPTPWLLDRVPAGEIVPVPSMVPRAKPGDPNDDTIRVLHVAGHRAAGDRNGTDLFLHSIRSVRYPIQVRVVSQDGEIRLPRMPAHIDIELVPDGVVDRWEMYEGVHLLVSPRRYGGLSLPVVEAASVGCAVAMTDCPPNHVWPIIPMRAQAGRAIRVPIGDVQAHLVKTSAMSFTIDEAASNRDFLSVQMDRSLQWAEEHSPARLRAVYDEILTSW